MITFVNEAITTDVIIFIMDYFLGRVVLGF